jgi:aminoglycoside phosphotransferase (APT) family kinase protein
MSNAEAPPALQAQLADALLAHLRRAFLAPELRFEGRPAVIQLEGGENLIASLQFAGGPPELSGPLILRRYPPDGDARGVLCERAIHENLLARGYPVPRVVYCTDDPGPIGGAFLLLERLAVGPLLSELGRLQRIMSSPRALALELPALVRLALGRVPRDLAEHMLALHALDAGPIQAAIRDTGFSSDHFSVAGRLSQLDQRARRAELTGLFAAIDWLRATVPTQRAPVLCHGDLHFWNVIVDGDRTTGVIDWSPGHLCFADREFDAGNTSVLLRLRFPGLPVAVRPLVHAVQRGMERRFLSLYSRSHPLDRTRVRWSGTYRLVREMVWAGESLVAARRPPPEPTPAEENIWLIPEVRQQALLAIERACGVSVTLPTPKPVP